MDAIWDDIEWGWDDHPQPDKQAVMLATALLKALEKTDVFPGSASSGRYPTVRLFWQDGRVEVEVSPRSIELYVFPRADENAEFSISEYDAASPHVLERVIEKIKDAVMSKNNEPQR